MGGRRHARADLAAIVSLAQRLRANRQTLRVTRGVVPIIGIELMTYRLQGGCSTN